MGYYFVISVFEGEPGFRSDDEYTSGMYRTLKDCVSALEKFNPNTKWNYLRSVRYCRIYSSATGKYINYDK